MTHRSAAAGLDNGFIPFGLNQGSLLRQALVVIAGSLFLVMCARISVPMIPVPITMQTFGVVLIGALFGSRLAVLTCLTYLAQGALGAPVFANGGFGLAHLVGPTGGYLLAFPIAAGFVGMMAERGHTRGLWRLMAIMLVAELLILSLGTLYLSTLIGLSKAVAAGFLPFLIGSVLKAGLATAIAELAVRRSAARAAR